jgi:hypothetical protein
VRAVRDTLEVLRTPRFWVKRHAGLMRGLERDLIPNGGGKKLGTNED